MSKYIFYLFFMYSMVHNNQSKSILSILTDNPIASALKSNRVVVTIEDNISNNTITRYIKDSIKLNCFGIPVELFADVIENVFTRTTKAQDVRFYFYSRDQTTPVTVLAKSKIDDLSKINFSTQRNTVVISHGFMSNGRVDWVVDMAEAFLQMDDLNVIVVDWEQGSNTWNYYEASISTRIVGIQIATLLYKIKQKGQSSNSTSDKFGTLHLVGHSLGAHICAHSSYQLRDLQKDDSVKWDVLRITGLDPAQPCFASANLTLKLDKSDAWYVDVIHSNGRQLLLMGLGLPNQIGSDDFYPNGGKTQLGCDNMDIPIIKTLMLPVTLIKSAVCSHGRSYQLFTDSIRVKLSGSCVYRGRRWNQKYENLKELLKDKCDEDVCPELGINAIDYRNQDNDGIYFVPTGDKPHFCDITKENRAAIEKQLRTDEFQEDPIAVVANKVFG